MQINEGDIFYIIDFEFKNKGTVAKKNKYLIALLTVDETSLLFSLPTSQQYISPERDQEGCIDYPDMGISLYKFPAGKVIGIDGFSFEKDTYIIYRQIFESNAFELDRYRITNQLSKLDQLTQNELVEVLYCALKSTQIPLKYKPLLEQKLEELLG